MKKKTIENTKKWVREPDCKQNVEKGKKEIWKIWREF